MQNNTQPRKIVKPFWAITIIAVVALVLGGVIYFFTQGYELNEDIYSISFSAPVQIHKHTKKSATIPVTEMVTSTPVSK